ncbi:hypothetical protein P4S64_06965 [Vibrio sp. M60_M31a]
MLGQAPTYAQLGLIMRMAHIPSDLTDIKDHGLGMFKKQITLKDLMTLALRIQKR